MTFNGIAQGIIQIFESVIEERDRAMVKWGIQSHPDGTRNGMWNRKARDHQRQIVDEQSRNGDANWYDILLEEVLEVACEEDLVALDNELNQVMQVCTVWREDIARRMVAVAVTEAASERLNDRDEAEMRRIAGKWVSEPAMSSLAHGGRPGRLWMRDTIARLRMVVGGNDADDLDTLAQWVKGLPSSWWDANFQQDAFGHALPKFSRGRPVENVPLPEAPSDPMANSALAWHDELCVYRQSNRARPCSCKRS